MPKDFNSGRIWARTNCAYSSNGLFTCETGGCDFLECASGGIQRGGKPPATLAEITINGAGNKDFYDVSLVDGFNLRIKMNVRNPNNDENGKYWCKNPNCDKDLNIMCPKELQKRNNKAVAVGCSSACEKFNTDQYCCRGNIIAALRDKFLHN